MSLAPVLFISHGAPTFALEPGQLGERLGAIGRRLRAAEAVRAVLVVSPHWMSRDLRVMTGARPRTMHDFGGFPPPLYELDYPAPGHPALAAEAARLLTTAGWPATADAGRDFDHGAWVPLRHLWPAADLPLFQVSLPQRLDPAGALALGRALAPLREQGVLIVGSGSLTHNLYDLQPPGSPTVAYASEFAAWVREAVQATDGEAALVGYRRLAPHAARAHPTEEHFLPLLVACGARRPADPLEVLPGDITYGVLSMESYAWGLPTTPSAPSTNA